MFVKGGLTWSLFCIHLVLVKKVHRKTEAVSSYFEHDVNLYLSLELLRFYDLLYLVQGGNELKPKALYRCSNDFYWPTI